MSGPPAASAPAPAPSYDDPSAQAKLEAAQKKQQKAVQQMQGRSSTILTSALGDTSGTSSIGTKKTLLGG